jgi:hypothetical protein
VVWFGIIIYIARANWIFVVFVVGILGYGFFTTISALRSLPREKSESCPRSILSTPAQQPMAFSAVRKADDYTRWLVLLFPGFAIAGLVTLAFTLRELGTGIFEWRRLYDLIVPGSFALLGCAGSWSAYQHRVTTLRILKNPVCVMGIVTRATYSGLRYRFRDTAGIEHNGEGTEYSGYYYEEMEVPVVYERDNPKNNLPVSALYDVYEVHSKLSELSG